MADVVILFSGQTANATSTEKLLDFSSADAQIEAFGVFGGASVTLETSTNDGGNYVPLTDITRSSVIIVAPEMLSAKFSYNTSIRATITGATGSTNITVNVRRLGRR